MPQKLTGIDGYSLNSRVTGPSNGYPEVTSLTCSVNDSETVAAKLIPLTLLGSTITNECKDVEINKKTYSTRLGNESVELSTSSTLMALLSEISKKLNNTTSAYLIANIITGVVTNFPTSLQIALGVLMRNSKALVNQLSKFGVTCTYDEVLRFKKSAAVAAASSASLKGISDSTKGLVQVVVDNFDADIASQNGKLSTHSLALLVTQQSSEESRHSDENKDESLISRIEKDEMPQPIDYEINLEQYDGPKKADMPESASLKKVKSLKLLAETASSIHRAKEIDTAFLKKVVDTESCPEFNGFNTKLCREQGHSQKPETKAVYLPLIDRSPSDPNTIMTALKQSQIVAKQCGQEYIVFTADLQLYREALNIVWAQPNTFGNVMLRLGGMHTFMSFVGSVGTLMEGSGLDKVLESTFGGVMKMLSGKKFPPNVRALRLLTEELLQELLQTNEIKCSEDLDRVLDELSYRSKTCKLWVDCVIKPVFIMMMFTRAERENDWGLHLCAVKAIIHFFFAAGHVHYARYCLYYLRSMEAMPESCQAQFFLKGQHVMRHIPGTWNGIWSDMFIETTFMRYGHGKKGIIGITLKPDTLKIWSLSLHICSKLEEDITRLTSDEDVPQNGNSHKEEASARMKNDAADRESLKKALQDCINPLEPSCHPVELINVVSGQIAPDTVNVDQALEIGTEQMKEFEKGWPLSFHGKISRKVKTQAEGRIGTKVGDTTVFDTELIFSRVVGIQASSREFDIREFLTYELSPVPTSLFCDKGKMRLSKSKSVLKRVLKHDVSVRCAERSIETTVIDGSAVLYVIRWPSVGTVADYVLDFRRYIERKLVTSDVYLVFDRYKEYSTKSITREARGSKTHRVHNLTQVMQIPPQKTVLSVPENKVQLIAIIVAELRSKLVVPDEKPTRKLVVTGNEVAPVEISHNVAIERRDISTTHEEADNIIVQQMVMAAKENPGGVCVISDDTDVFVLLLHHYLDQNLSNTVVMESPVRDRTAIDITESVRHYKDIIHDLAAAHAITGSDTTACCHGIGKGTAVKVLKTQIAPLSCVGDANSDLSMVVKQATRFIAHCYNVKSDETDMSSVRQTVWSLKVGKAAACAPKIAALPPTTEAFVENVKCAHLQACVWKHALDPDPPNLEPTEYGWVKQEDTKSLVPVMLPLKTAVAPEAVLKMIRCACDSQTSCSTMRCRCKSARMSCTLFCTCQGSALCFNEQTVIA